LERETRCAFLKIDKGLAAEKDGVQLMKPMPDLEQLLKRAKAKHIFGTKMRSFIKQANAGGIKDIVSQQFEVAQQIITAGLVPIIEPEVDIHCPQKGRAEELLRSAILENLNELRADEWVMLKITCQIATISMLNAPAIRTSCESSLSREVTRANRLTSGYAEITKSWRASRARW
jgi:fructose-bisphosphate aldolase class 1